MAITALHSAATGLRALSTRIDVVANNLANAETTAFKRSRANFEDLYYLALKQPGTPSSNGIDVSGSGIYVGLGTKISNTQVLFEQGSLEDTRRPLDIGIQGEGFFRLQTIDSVGGGTAYTRNGNFYVNRDGALVLGIGDGYRLVPDIPIPAGATDISISDNGTVSYTPTGAATSVEAGRLEITQFQNPQGLKLLGAGLFIESESSGPPLNGFPGENGNGITLQGFLETSNVDPVKELVTLIKTQRAFELNSQSIQTADQALQTIANLRR